MKNENELGIKRSNYGGWHSEDYFVYENSATELQHISKIVSDFYSEKVLKNHKTNICVGLSVIDLTTGKSVIYETIADSEDNTKAYDEIYRFINFEKHRNSFGYNIKKLDTLL